ncbi:MAG: class I tRNA ligase family protein, partial [Lachnospiraceae bacterium]|nr:class I tRNA ligase family protein [Lachnospiraceae bacterium]
RYPEFVVNPSDIVKNYGADTLRLYEMFMGPLEVSKPWSTAGVDGARKYVNRVFAFFSEKSNIGEGARSELEKVYHQMVRKVTDDFEKLAFNTAISQFMIFTNAVYKAGSCPQEFAEGFVKMFSCVCPHAGEELWSILGHNETLAYEKWPEYDEKAVQEDAVEIGVQVNGKVRTTVRIPKNAAKEEALEAAKEALIQAGKLPEVIRKEIYVPCRIINFVG